MNENALGIVAAGGNTGGSTIANTMAGTLTPRSELGSSQHHVSSTNTGEKATTVAVATAATAAFTPPNLPAPYRRRLSSTSSSPQQPATIRKANADPLKPNPVTANPRPVQYSVEEMIAQADKHGAAVDGLLQLMKGTRRSDASGGQWKGPGGPTATDTTTDTTTDADNTSR
ncbi:hypothetical protein KEM55_003413 [Ascosphaera atra]|nr:hypothetical protein KEM55_003413 [Ascosphaera atra]